MKNLIMIAGFAVAANASAGTSKLDWNENAMVHACVEAVTKHAVADASRGTVVRFDARNAHAQMLTDDTFVCLVVGDRREVSERGERREARAYSATVKPLPIPQSRVQSVPAL